MTYEAKAYKHAYYEANKTRISAEMRASPKDNASNSQVYRAWVNLRQRCNNPRFKAYKNYGGRGIKVCEAWDDYAQFKRDVGEPPTPHHTIDRKNNEGDYEPTNVRWATRSEQMHNVRINVYISHGGERLIMSDWARRCGVNPAAMLKRISTWGAEKAVSTFNQRKV